MMLVSMRRACVSELQATSGPIVYDKQNAFVRRNINSAYLNPVYDICLK
jgi:hypothetical protein